MKRMPQCVIDAISTHNTGWPKNGTVFLNPLTLSNIKPIFKILSSQNQEKICNNITTKDPTTPQVCRGIFSDNFLLILTVKEF